MLKTMRILFFENAWVFRPFSILLFGVIIWTGFIQANAAVHHHPNDQGQVAGRVTDKSTGEVLTDCNIIAQPSGQGTTTDSLGLYILELPPGHHTIRFSYLGYKTLTETVRLTAKRQKIRLDVEMQPLPLPGEAITVLGERESQSPQIRVIDSTDIKRIPAVYSDGLRAVKILPGVTSNNELSSAYSVRGGNFDENLIYLNGFEIFRPFLLRRGQQENRSLVNPSMVKDIQFYNGTFPTGYSDKMSSVLSVRYRNHFPGRLSGTVNLNLFHLGLTLSGRYHTIQWIAGIRYANPQLFSTQFQTRGDYRPLFADAQAVLHIPLRTNSQLQIVLLNAYNRFNLTPGKWTGHFKTDPFGMDVRSVEINYRGKRHYTFHTALYGLRYSRFTSDSTRLNFALSYFTNKETEDNRLTGEIYYIPDARNPGQDRELLKSNQERVDNQLHLHHVDLQTTLQRSGKIHIWKGGLHLRLRSLEDRIDEYFVEAGEDLLERPLTNKGDKSYRLKNWSAFLQDEMNLTSWLRLNIDLRFTRVDYTNEKLWSPRGTLTIYPRLNETMDVSAGYYYQPPYYHEFRAQNGKENSALRSQLAIQYNLGWEHRFHDHLKLRIETYYKDLKYLIPYDIDRVKLIYREKNNAKGYAYGVDFLVQGEIIRNLNSWISYSYLNSKEKIEDVPGGYRRRLLDQRHTVRIFLQDRLPEHPNYQSHVRLLFGSGYLYHPQKVMTDESSGQQFLTTDWEKRWPYPLYFRVDMGLTARYRIASASEVTLSAEVLNVFNHTNVAAYSWFRINENRIVRIPHVFTGRFFNLGVEMSF